MCKRCKAYYSNDNLVSIKTKPVKFGKFDAGLVLDLFICDGEISADLFDMGNNTIATVSAKIKYCPFCGEKLKDVE